MSPSKSNRSTRYVNLAERIPWDALTAEDVATLREIEVPISLGYSTAEVATMTGWRLSDVLARRRKLRARLLELAGEPPER